MRKQFVECETATEATERCPWACVIVMCEGGFQCFESVVDARDWYVDGATVSYIGDCEVRHG